MGHFERGTHTFACSRHVKPRLTARGALVEVALSRLFDFVCPSLQVVAVLLDEFVESVTKDRNSEIEKDLEKEKQKQRSFGSPIDPLLAVLSSFTTSADLSDRIKKVFELLDHEGVGSVDHEDMMYGLRKLSFSPPIHLSFDDFHTMVRDHGGSSVASNAILDEKGRMDIHGFEILISEQLRHYVQRRTAQAMQGAAASGSSIGHVLFVLKLISTNLENVSTTIDRVDSRVDKLEATIAGDADDADRASNPIPFDRVSSAGAFDRLSSSAEDGSVASPSLPGAASTSANGFAFQGTRIPVDVALHCKMDKLINMMANLTSILTPTSVATLGSVALGARTDRKLSPVLTVKPASKQGASSSPSLLMQGGDAAMRQFADTKEPAGDVHSSYTAKSMATSARAALGSKAISGNEFGALDRAAAASAQTPVVANGIIEKQHLTILHAQCAEASISQQPVSVVESVPRQWETQQDSGRSHHTGTTHESTLVNSSSDPARTSIPAWSVDLEMQESPQLASTSQGVKPGPGSALGGSIARRSGRVMSPALESKIQDLMKADEDEHDDGAAVLGVSASGSLKVLFAFAWLAFVLAACLGC
jgi:Ca2+-binding EF-hand superfamily protein